MYNLISLSASLTLLLTLQIPLIILGVTDTASDVPNPSDHSPPLTVIHSITPLYVQIIHILVHTCFPGHISLSSSLNLQSNTLFTQSSSSFLTTCPYHHSLFL